MHTIAHANFTKPEGAPAFASSFMGTGESYSSSYQHQALLLRPSDCPGQPLVSVLQVEIDVAAATDDSGPQYPTCYEQRTAAHC